MVTVGDQAPDFTLKDKEGKEITLSKIKSKFTLVYFYPKDDTSGCTIEAVTFTKKKPEFDKVDATIIGISGGDDKSKAAFCMRHNIKLTLLSDPELDVCKAYGVYWKKQFLGKSFFGIRRQTFLLDKQKKIVKFYDSVKPERHPDEVLQDIISMK